MTYIQSIHMMLMPLEKKITIKIGTFATCMHHFGTTKTKGKKKEHWHRTKRLSYLKYLLSMLGMTRHDYCDNITMCLQEILVNCQHDCRENQVRAQIIGISR